MKNFNKLVFFGGSCLTIMLALVAGVIGGFAGGKLSTGNNINDITKGVISQNVQVNESSAIIDVAQKASNSVVSIVISQNVPLYQNSNTDPYSGNFQDLLNQLNGNSPNLIQPNTPTPDSTQKNGTLKQQVGAGTGFIISQDGMIITNRHVVEDKTASYTVIFNDGKKYDAKILAVDTLLDIAFIKINANNLTPLQLGSSTNLKVGQRVVAIGNALGQFSNTVSSGIISGLKRNLTAQDSNGTTNEQLTNVIQTDASINLGNSGGPLLDIEGNVVGVNVAIAQNAQNIGFAIPVDVIKDLLTRFNKDGQIERPRLGIRYQLVTPELKTKNSLTVDYGALVSKGATASDLAVIPGSPAAKAGIIENDIVLEVNGKKIDQNNTLSSVIQQYRIGDVVNVKILRNNHEQNISVKLDKFTN